MSKANILLIAAAVLLVSGIIGQASVFAARASKKKSAFTVCSFNIRYANNKGDCFPDGSSAAWADRRDAVKTFVESVKPDIIGLQEVRKVQAEDFMEFFGNEYGYYDVGRDSPTGASIAEADCEGVGVLYRKDRFDLVDKGFFWLDGTPGTLPVRNDDKTFGDWHSACRRVAAWTLLSDKRRGSLIAFYSTHFDHRSKVARQQAAALMAERMDSLKADVVIAMGDLNTRLDDGWLRPLEEKFAYARNTAPGSDRNTGTFNGFGKRDTDIIIDHIFYGGNVVPLLYWVEREGYGVPMLSDHYPVLLRLDYGKRR